MKKPDWKIWINDKEECKSWLKSYLDKGIIRKRKENSLLYIKKAEHNLNLANWIFEKHDNEIKEIFGSEVFYDWIINIYYYAVYHSALALISKEGYKSKNHSASLCFLIYHHYHKNNLINEEDINFLVFSLSREEIELISSLDLMVSLDSANMHLANLTGIPVLSIWGGTHPDMGFKPDNQPDEYLIQTNLDLACRPCSVFGTSECKLGSTPLICLTSISPENISDKIESILC